MAEYIIKSDSDAIISITDKIEEQITYMVGYINEMQSKINDLHYGFTSAEEDKFVSRYSYVSNYIKASLANFKSEMIGLRKAAVILETESQKTASDVDVLPEAGVFENA